MRLDLNKVPKAGRDLDRAYPPDAFPRGGEDDYAVAAPVVLRCRVTKDGERYRVKGAVATELELTCSRCLEPFRYPVAADFDVIYLPHTANEGDGEIEIADEDLSTAFYRDDEIDLGQLMREQFYLALPMKPLHDAACKGLCPVCGTNLNRGACQCAVRWEDPRLEPLKRLLKEPADK
jgi:uncharacterized protein